MCVVGGGGACITVGARVRAAFVRTCVRRVCVCVFGPTSGGEGGGTEREFRTKLTAEGK